MELAAIVVFAVVVAAVVIDAARGHRREPARDESVIATDKIVIDLRERK